MSRIAAVAAALLAAACDVSGPDPGPIDLRLRPNVQPIGGCPSDDPAAYEMSCGAKLSVRVLEAPRPDPDAPQAVLGSDCVDVPPSADLTGLRDAMVDTFLDIPTEMLEIEVALWNPDVLAADPELEGACPTEDIFDLQGVPRITFEPQPAFGGSKLVDAGSGEETAVIPLACTNPDQLAGCELERTRVATTEIVDVQGLLDITPDQADGLLVGVAEPRSVPVNVDGVIQVVTRIDSPRILPLLPGPVPVFQDFVDQTFGDTLCTVVIENVAQATSAVVCERVEPGASEIELTEGAFLDKETLDGLLAAAGMDQFPAEGLVVGRVVDHTGLQPLADVSVAPQGADDAEILYLNGSLDGLNLSQETSQNGFFLARDVPFDTLWTALHNGDNRIQDGEFRAGVVEGKVTVLIIEMQEPPQAG